MTSPTGTGRHPDVSEIADLSEGILAASDAREVRRHVENCALCGDVFTSLEELRGLLGSMADTGPMPGDIALRIDEALAAETSGAKRRGDVSRETSPTRQVSGEPSASAVRPLNGMRPVGASTVAPRHRTSSRPGERSGEQSGGSSGPGRSARRRRRAVLGTAFAAAVLGMGGYLLQALGAGDMKADSTADRSLGAAERGGDMAAAGSFSGSALEDRVADLLSPSSAPAEKGASPSAKDLSPRAASPENPLRAPAASVPACVQRATGRSTAAAAVEEGVYREQEAFLVVLPHPSDAALVTAYVVGASCVADAPDTTGVLLFTHVYPRP